MMDLTDIRALPLDPAALEAAAKRAYQWPRRMSAYWGWSHGRERGALLTEAPPVADNPDYYG